MKTTTTTMIKLVISGPFLPQNLKTYKQNFSPKIYLEVPYPEVFWGGRFFDKCSKEKNRIELGGLGGAVSLPQWAPEEKPQKILAI